MRLSGHAVEARVSAEDPARGFLPTGGRVLALAEPDLPGVRVDSGLSAGTEVGSAYDPMLAKVIAWGPDRGEALRRLDRALAATAVLGVGTNIAFLRALLGHPDVVAGRLDTGLVERDLAELASDEVPAHVYVAGALKLHADLEPGPAGGNRFAVADGWRIGGPAWTPWRLQQPGSDPVIVSVRGRASAASVRIGDGEPVPATASVRGDELIIGYDGAEHAFRWARDQDVLWLAADGHAWALREQEPLAAAGHGETGPAGGGVVRSPMPGTIVAVHAEAGTAVSAGTPLFVVEAMKMEHVVPAPADAVVTEVRVRPGQHVAVDEPLAVLAEAAEPAAG